MRPVAPRLELDDGTVVDEDLIELEIPGDPAAGFARATVYARYRRADGIQVIVSRWRFSEEERERLIHGDDLYLFELGPMRELAFHVGEPTTEYLQG